MSAVSLKVLDFNKDSFETKSYNLPTLEVKSAKSVAYVIRWQLARRRAGSAKTKTMAEVSGTTAKPWKQKGTGRARQGSRRSVQFVGGRTCHGPMPRSFDFTMPKKIIDLALADALRFKIKDNKVAVFEGSPKIVKTNKIYDLLKKNGFEKVLFVYNEKNENLTKSIRNIKNVKAIEGKALNVYDILNYDHVIVENNLIETKIIKAIE
ncbi:50S ribosomal protein L4 [Alphaproteobacteria bacterium]|nr:50S ribosomal protein L4 [Alphaproteobacteria bacterium]